MKYKYTIFVQSDYEEDQLVAKLEEIGLQKIFVEKFSDIDAIVADQNNFIDENFDDKFQRLVAAEVFPPEMTRRLTAVFADENKKTMQELFKAIHSIGVELDMSNYRIERIINKAIDINLKSILFLLN